MPKDARRVACRHCLNPTSCLSEKKTPWCFFTQTASCIQQLLLDANRCDPIFATKKEELPWLKNTLFQKFGLIKFCSFIFYYYCIIVLFFPTLLFNGKKIKTIKKFAKNRSLITIYWRCNTLVRTSWGGPKIESLLGIYYCADSARFLYCEILCPFLSKGTSSRGGWTVIWGGGGEIPFLF